MMRNTASNRKQKKTISFRVFSEYIHILYMLGIISHVNRDSIIIDIVMKPWVK
jgi:hypothetical protein